MKQYKAIYTTGYGGIEDQVALPASKTETRYYHLREQAQYKLGRRIGYFPYLGRVSGDVFEDGVCDGAPRCGGWVSIEEREVEA